MYVCLGISGRHEENWKRSKIFAHIMLNSWVRNAKAEHERAPMYRNGSGQKTMGDRYRCNGPNQYQWTNEKVKDTNWHEQDEAQQRRAAMTVRRYASMVCLVYIRTAVKLQRPKPSVPSNGRTTVIHLLLLYGPWNCLCRTSTATCLILSPLLYCHITLALCGHRPNREVSRLKLPSRKV